MSEAPWVTRCATCFPPPTRENPFLEDYAATVMPSEQEAVKDLLIKADHKSETIAFANAFPMRLFLRKFPEFVDRLKTRIAAHLVRSAAGHQTNDENEDPQSTLLGDLNINGYGSCASCSPAPRRLHWHVI